MSQHAMMVARWLARWWQFGTVRPRMRAIAILICVCVCLCAVELGPLDDNGKLTIGRMIFHLYIFCFVGGFFFFISNSE